MSKIVQGNCLEVMKSFADGQFDAVITDPPYGIDYQSAWRTERLRKAKIANDKTPAVEWVAEAFRVTKDGGCLACFCRWDVEHYFRNAISSAGWQIKSQVIWDKDVHSMGDLRGEFAPQHENIIFAAKGRFTFPNVRPTTILRHRRVSPERLLHPNEKPVALMGNLARVLVPQGGSVIDPFFGSGALGVASEQLGINCTGIEIDKQYIKLAQERLSQPSLLSQPTQGDRKEPSDE